MDNTTLVSIIRAHRKDSLGVEDGDLSNQRATAMDHYHGRPYGNEVEGRSQVVSRDLAETVDWAMPTLMRTFVQAGNVAEFDPVGPEDEGMAQQESDYVNRVLMNDNSGVMIIHDTLKEALLLKNCYGKHWWSKEKKVRTESYTGLTIDEIAKMLADLEQSGAKVEIVGKQRKFVPMPGLPALPMMQQPNPEDEAAAPPPGMLDVFDIKIKVEREETRVRVEAVPVEEVRVSKKCRGSLQDSPFVEHVTKKTRSDLIEMGMSSDFVDSLPAYNENETGAQSLARDSVTDESDSTGASYSDRSMDEIEFCEAYIRVDWDGDGIAELRKVVTCADKIPPGEEWNEEIEACAITGGLIKRVPHRHVGESLDDELADLQEIVTVLKRQLLDNIYLTNNTEVAVNERANLKDLMTRTPGGVKRFKGLDPVAGAFVPFQTPSIVGDLLPVLDHYNKVKETRSGIRPGSDMDPDILRETTKGAFMEHLNRASQKIELIARLYAETFLKELVYQVHGLLIRHQDKPKQVKLRGKWVAVNPQEWRERVDLTVKVGLGTGNEEEKRQKLMMLGQMQMTLMQALMTAPKEVYAKGYAMFEDMCKTLGVDLPEKYAVAPDSPEHQALLQQRQNQPNPDVQKEQARGAIALQTKQAELQLQAQNDQRDAAREDARFQQEIILRREQMAYEDQRHEREMMFRRWEKEAEIAADLEKERIRTAGEIDAAQVSAQATLSAAQESASDAAVNDGGMA